MRLAYTTAISLLCLGNICGSWTLKANEGQCLLNCGGKQSNPSSSHSVSEQHTAVVLDGQDKRSQTIAILVIGGLIENQDAGVLPHGCCQHSLHFHASAHLGELSVAGRLRIDTEVCHMLFRSWMSELLGHQTCH